MKQDQCLSAPEPALDPSVKYERRYRVVYRWHRDEPLGSPNDWRSWRHFAHVPISFPSNEAAEAYIRMSDPFKNLRHHRKISCSVEPYMRPIKLPWQEAKTTPRGTPKGWVTALMDRAAGRKTLDELQEEGYQAHLEECRRISNMRDGL